MAVARGGPGVQAQSESGADRFCPGGDAIRRRLPAAARILCHRQSGGHRAQRQRAGHPCRGDGDRHHRPRHRPLGGRHHGHVGRLVFADDQQRYPGSDRAVDHACRCSRHRADQRVFCRLCRRAGDLRHACQRLLRLRLCAIPTDHPGRNAGATPSLDRTAGPHPVRERADRGVRVLGRGLPRLSLPALHQMGALHLSDGRQFHGGAQHGHSGAPDDRAALCAFGA